MNDTICFVAGKSGGHLLPCIALAKKICAQQPEKKILFFTNQSKLDKDILAAHPWITVHFTLPLSSVQPRSLFSYVSFAITMIRSLCISFYYLLKCKPQKIISTGGAVSLPVCFAGLLLKIPIELVELNVIPGKTVATLAPFATTLSVCFKETQKHFKQKSYITNYPLRFNATSRIPKADACKFLGLNPSKKTVFIIGGSQGSLFINNLIKQWIEQSSIDKDTLQFIHQIGSHDDTGWKELYAQLNVQAFIFSFYTRIEYCYSAADLIICRAGAGTLFEIEFFRKPCITIPLETKNTLHQIDNAYAFHMMHKDSFKVVLQKEPPQKIVDIFNTTISKIAAS